MQFNVKTIIPIIVSLLALFLLYQFRTVPVSQFWKGYRILYVYTTDLSENDILMILEKNGCDSVISYGQQRVPVLSQIAPIQTQDADSYLFKRNDFFTDKLHRARVFYIPESNSSTLEKSIRELSSFYSTSAGTDGKSSFPWIAPLISCLFFVLLLSFSKRKILFALGSISFLLFSFCRPLYTVSASVCLFLFAFFLFHRLWSRTDFLKTALNSPYILLFAGAPILVLLFSSPVLALFYLIAFVAFASFVFCYAMIEKQQEEKYSFQPIFIRSARMIPVVGHLGIRLLGILFVTILGIFFVFVLSGNVSNFSSNSTMPSLPAPVNKNEAELVRLNDFVEWSWNTITFPYRKLGEAEQHVVQDGEVVSITDYIEENGKIVPVENPAYIFNSEFRENIYKSIEQFDYPALEKLLLKQGKNANFGYAKSAQVSSTEKFGSFLLLILLAVPFAAGIYYILGRKRYGLSI